MHMNYEIKMPVKYAELSADEMEYDGGWLNFLAGVALSAVSIGCSVIAATTNNQKIAQAATLIGMAATIGSIALGAGAINTAMKAAWNVPTKILASAAYSASFTPVELAFTGSVAALTWPF